MQLGSIHDAAASGDLDLVKKIVEQEPLSVNQDDQYEWRPIFHAGLRRHYDVVKYLIDAGADLAAHDGYVIHYAGEVPDNKEVVSLLVAYGGLDAHAKPLSETARQFIYAVFLANVKRVSAMLRDNAKLVQERYARGDTALHHATRNGDLEIVEQLVSSGADVNVTSEHGHFPLYCAAGHGHVETTRYLVEYGADLKARLSDGKTVVEWLKQFADHDRRLKFCLDVLERY
ncbi:MAG: ankyrin repeat domain-containing protein [Candidatus Poribacteria bacterium]|nr:ankyrin repeat domain-containing protein [Candidatus Poribacteria bacterium]MDE0424554.1 ankyrin repeat domain-containing protein [Candidatus Poribacteria bacterium]